MDMKENLALTKEQEVIAYYKVPNMTVSVVDNKQKKKNKESVGRALKKLLPNKDFEIALVPKDYRLIEKMRETSKLLTPETKEVGLAHLNHTITYLENEIGRPYEYEWIIGVWLKKEKIRSDVRKIIEDEITKTTEKVMKKLGYEVEIDELWHEQYKDEEMEMLQRLGTLRPVKMTNESLYYHQRYQYIRYTKHEQDEVCASRNVLNVTDSIVEFEQGELKLITPYGESYISVLPIGKIPTFLNEQYIAERISRFNFPLELRIKAKFAEIDGSTGIKQKMGRSKTRTKNIKGEAQRSGSAQQDRIIEGSIALTDLEKKVGNKEPIIEYSMCIVVVGESKKQLRERRMRVLSALGDLEIKISRASYDQPYLFQSMLLGNKNNAIAKKWEHTSTAEGVAEQLLFSSTHSGTSTGFYLGRIDNHLGKWENVVQATRASRNLIMFNPTISNKENIIGKITKNPHIEITGETGTGKSVLAQIMFLQQSFTRTKLLYIDPKKTLREQYKKKCQDKNFRKKNPLLVKHLESFNYVTLDHNDKTNKGVLDPIIISNESDAIEVTKNMISSIGEGKFDMQQETAISKEVKRVVSQRANNGKVGAMDIVTNLQKHEDKHIRDVGDYLYERIEGSLLELAFSTGDVKGLSYNERVTILEVANLSLPDKEGNSKMTDSQKNSVILMIALGNFCKRFGEMNPNEDTMEFIDEAWVLRRSAEGQAVIMSIRRVGRSMNNSLVLITQSVNDNADDDDTTGFGTTFAFNEPNEQEDILRHMKLEVNEENLKWLSSMTAGQCLFRDVFGNVNRISIDIFDPTWLELFSTVENTIASENENKFSRNA